MKFCRSEDHFLVSDFITFNKKLQRAAPAVAGDNVCCKEGGC